MNNPLISVVIPVYNCAPYIKEALDSIFNQDYDNFEVVVVNDCSTDDTETFLDLFNEYPNFTYYNLKCNSGIVAALNLAIQYSKGDFIARMDGDDISYSNRLSLQLDYLLSNNYDLIGSVVEYISEDGEYIGLSKYLDDNQILISLPFKSPLGHPTWFAKRSVFSTLNGYLDCAPVEDYDFLCRAISYDFKVGMINKPLLQFRTQINAGGTALTKGLLQRKLFTYIRSVYLNSNNTYSQDQVDLIKVKFSGGFGSYLFKISQKFYARSMRYRHSHQYFLYLFFLLLSLLLSPSQFYFFIMALMLKAKLKLSKA